MTVSLPDTATLTISEQFGPTLQGEGPFAGRAVQFIRTMGCNLSCSWCDTPYTWDGSRYDLRAEGTAKSLAAIVDDLIVGVPLVVSGGEPLMHQHSLVFQEMLTRAWRKGCDVHVETNGTIEPNAAVRSVVRAFAVSPKLNHAGRHRGRQNPAMAAGWARLGQERQAFLKIVVRDAAEVTYVAEWALERGWPKEQTWVMPLGTDTAALLAHWPEIASAAAASGINATQRLHVLAWGDVKGT